MAVKLPPRPFNPIALREMKVRMRGTRSFALLGVHLLLLSLFILTIYLRKGATSSYSYGGSTSSGNYGPTRNFETGQDIFISVFLYLIVMVAIVTPAICGGLVSREMEDGTYDMILVTPVRGHSLVYGKLAAAFGFMAIMILASLPVACVVFLFGGVTVDNLVAGFAIVLVEAFVLSNVSLFFSGLFRRTSTAIIVTFGFAFLLLVGVPIVSSSITAGLNTDTSRPGGSFTMRARIDPAFDLPKRILVFNPVAALGSVLAPNAPYRAGNGEDLQYFPNSRLYWGKPEVYYSSLTFSPDSDAARYYYLSKLPTLFAWSLWQVYLLIYAAIGLVFLLLSVGAVKPLPRRPGFNPFRRLLPRSAVPARAAVASVTATAPAARAARFKFGSRRKATSTRPATLPENAAAIAAVAPASSSPVETTAVLADITPEIKGENESERATTTGPESPVLPAADPPSRPPYNPKALG